MQPFVTGALMVLGGGFLVANARLLLEYARFRRIRAGALLIWPTQKPPYYRLALALGLVFGLLLFYKIVVLHRQAFGEGMMFLYYGYVLPLSLRIRRGFYEDGIWADNAFIPYSEVGGISWREGKQQVTLIVISRLRHLARRLAVPVENYAAARRLLRDKVAQHDIHFAGTGLDLGGHDAREDRRRVDEAVDRDQHSRASRRSTGGGGAPPRVMKLTDWPISPGALTCQPDLPGKGFLKVSLVNIPIKVFPATESSATISFNQLHGECQTRIQQKRWCPTCSREVPNSEIVKGYEFERGRYVVLAEEDFEKVRPESTRVIDLAQFADESAIDPMYVDRDLLPRA